MLVTFAMLISYLANEHSLAPVDRQAGTDPVLDARIGAYRFWHRHVALLLAAAGRRDADALAHAALAPLAGDHLHAVVAELGAERVRAAVLALVDGVVGGG